MAIQSNACRLLLLPVHYLTPLNAPCIKNTHHWIPTTEYWILTPQPAMAVNGCESHHSHSNCIVVPATNLQSVKYQIQNVQFTNREIYILFMIRSVDYILHWRKKTKVSTFSVFPSQNNQWLQNAGKYCKIRKYDNLFQKEILKISFECFEILLRSEMGSLKLEREKWTSEVYHSESI